jgi:hypothetical protein
MNYFHCGEIAMVLISELACRVHLLGGNSQTSAYCLVNVHSYVRFDSDGHVDRARAAWLCWNTSQLAKYSTSATLDTTASGYATWLLKTSSTAVVLSMLAPAGRMSFLTLSARSLPPFELGDAQRREFAFDIWQISANPSVPGLPIQSLCRVFRQKSYSRAS